MREWRVRRVLQPHPDGQRRWERAYQQLLAWGQEAGVPAAAEGPEPPAKEVIPARSNLDLFQIRVAGEAANALWGERIPGAAESVDDGVVVVEQAVAQMPLA